MSDLDRARDLLRERRERTPDRLALIDAGTDEQWDYAEFDRFVDRVARSLDRAGIEPGDTVATLLDARPVSVALPFATVRLGATLAPLNVGLDRATIGDQIERLEPSVLLCATATEAVAVECFDGAVLSVDAPSNPAVDRFDPAAIGHRDANPNGDPDVDSDANSGANPSASPHTGTPLHPDDTALVVFTSGTTGRPKGVRLTPGNLLSSAASSASRLGVTPHDRWLSPLSTYHVGGIAPYLRSTLYGTAAVLQREFDPTETARTLDRHDVTCVSLVPTMLQRLLDAGWRPGPSFRFVLLGGGPAPDSLLERCLDEGVPVCPTYGATETASQVATATPADVAAAPGTVGRPLSGTSIEIVADGTPCEAGTTGELVVDGPTVTPGYLDPDATAEAFEDGRFHTGDRGYRDEAGRLWIEGRADDVVVTGGENVQPPVVVAAIEEHPAVVAAAVVGVPDAQWGERVVALVVADAELTGEDLRGWCRDRVPDFAVPKAIAFAERLPRTPSGTIDRSAVRERFE